LVKTKSIERPARVVRNDRLPQKASELTKSSLAQKVPFASAIFGMDHPDDEGHNTKQEAKVRIAKDEGRKTATGVMPIIALRT
jgi:hypothetical protein